MVNKLIVRMEEYIQNDTNPENIQKEMTPDELLLNSEDLIQQQSEISQHVADIQEVDNLQSDINAQEEFINNENNETTVEDVINAEIQLENYSKLFSGYSANKVKKAFGMESFSRSQTLKEMLKTNLGNKKILLATVQEAINDSKAGILSRIADFFTRGSKEYNKYLSEISDLIKETEKSDKENIKTDIEISPLTGTVMTTDILSICSKNFSLMMKNKSKETKNSDALKLKAEEYYLTTPEDIYSGNIVSRVSFIPCAVKEKSTARAEGTKIGTLFEDTKETFTIYGVENGSDGIVEVVECLPKFNIDDFKPEKLGLKSKSDIIKAMKNIETKAKQAYDNVKEGLRPDGFMKKERENSRLGNINVKFTDSALKNDLNLHNVRIARLCYHCCVELSKLLSK